MPTSSKPLGNSLGSGPFLLAVPLYPSTFSHLLTLSILLPNLSITNIINFKIKYYLIPYTHEWMGGVPSTNAARPSGRLSGAGCVWAQARRFAWKLQHVRKRQSGFLTPEIRLHYSSWASTQSIPCRVRIPKAAYVFAPPPAPDRHTSISTAHADAQSTRRLAGGGSNDFLYNRVSLKNHASTFCTSRWIVRRAGYSVRNQLSHNDKFLAAACHKFNGSLTNSVAAQDGAF